MSYWHLRVLFHLTFSSLSWRNFMSNLLQIENYRRVFCLAVSVDLELDYSCCLYTETDVLHKYLFYMASPASRQHEPNELGITIYVLKNGKSFILKITWYWLRSLFASLCPSTPSGRLNSQKRKNKVNIQLDRTSLASNPDVWKAKCIPRSFADYWRASF